MKDLTLKVIFRLKGLKVIFMPVSESESASTASGAAAKIERSFVQ